MVIVPQIVKYARVDDFLNKLLEDLVCLILMMYFSPQCLKSLALLTTADASKSALWRKIK